MSFVVGRRSGPGAEKAASECVVNFLKERYPYIIKEATMFYVSCSGDEYECGVKLDGDRSGISLTEAGGHKIVRYPGGMYARLDDNCFGDAGVHVSELGHWLVQNGLAYRGQKIFAVYEAENGSKKTGIKECKNRS